MSHFSVLVIGKDPERQLFPFNERTDELPREYLKFNDQEEESRKEYETETRKEFYCSSSSSWGMEVTDLNLRRIKNRKIGEEAVFEVSKGGMNYYKKDGTYRLYYGKPEFDDDKDPWIRVKQIIHTDHPDQDVCFNGSILVERIASPREIPLKEFYPTFEDFMNKWHGMEAPDEETGKYGYWCNPNAKWDWYQLGGRWTGFFKLKLSVDEFGLNVPDHYVGEPGLMTKKAEAGYADRLMKKDIDFEGMRDEAAEKAGERYDKVNAVVGHLPYIKPWSEFIAEFDEEKKTNEDVNIEKYRDAYHSQERCKAVRKKAESNDPDKNDFVWVELDEFNCTREEFVQRARNRATATFAVVKDGKWYERGEMGWWGMTSNEVEENDWLRAFNNWIDECPDDTLFSLYDCHI